MDTEEERMLQARSHQDTQRPQATDYRAARLHTLPLELPANGAGGLLQIGKLSLSLRIRSLEGLLRGRLIRHRLPQRGAK